MEPDQHGEEDAQNDEVELTVRNIASDFWRQMLDEYESRTKFGKLLYPLWLLKSAYLVWAWSMLILFIYTMAFFMNTLEMNWTKTLKKHARLPAIHRDD